MFTEALLISKILETTSSNYQMRHDHTNPSKKDHKTSKKREVDLYSACGEKISKTYVLYWKQQVITELFDPI